MLLNLRQRISPPQLRTLRSQWRRVQPTKLCSPQTIRLTARRIVLRPRTTLLNQRQRIDLPQRITLRSQWRQTLRGHQTVLPTGPHHPTMPRQLQTSR
jgi:hypothetical protein